MTAAYQSFTSALREKGYDHIAEKLQATDVEHFLAVKEHTPTTVFPGNASTSGASDFGLSRVAAHDLDLSTVDNLAVGGSIAEAMRASLGGAIESGQLAMFSQRHSNQPNIVYNINVENVNMKIDKVSKMAQGGASLNVYNNTGRRTPPSSDASCSDNSDMETDN